MTTKGINKKQVLEAKDRLLAMDKRPTIDAIRVELGMTGSRTTISRLLKEIDQEENGSNAEQNGRLRIAVSEPLLDLVSRLSERLQIEADEIVQTAKIACATHVQTIESRLAVVTTTLATKEECLHETARQLADETAAHKKARDTITEMRITQEKLSQQIEDLGDRLKDNETHRLSLEEKHQHTRQTLEHYRESVKLQREQDQQRHEQEMQTLQLQLRTANQTVVVKQGEISALATENARHIAELAAARDKVGDQAAAIARLDADKTELKRLVTSSESRIEQIQKAVSDSASEVKRLNEHAKTQDQIIQWSSTKAKEFEVQIERLTEKLSIQDELLAVFRATKDHAAAKLSECVDEEIADQKTSDGSRQS